MPDLIYRIDSKESKFLRLHLSERHALRKRVLYLSTLKELTKEADKEPLALLVKAKLRTSSNQSADTISFQQIDLYAKEAAPLLRLLVKTGRLFFEAEPVKEIIDAKLLWEAQEEGGGCRAEGVLWAQKKISLRDCKALLFVPELCAYFNETLLIAPCAIGSKWPELAKTGPLFLEGVQRRRFFEDVEDVLFKKKEEVPLEVFPQLQLLDATGCFADLWMNYPGVGRVAFEDLSPFINGRKRLLEVEQGFARDLAEAFYQRKRVGRSSWYCPGDRVDEAISLLLGVGWQLFDAKELSIVLFKEWGCRLEESLGGIKLSLEASQHKALQALKENRRWVDLGDKTGWLDRKKGMQLFAGLLDKSDLELLPKEALGACLPLLDAAEVSWTPALRSAAEELRSQTFKNSILLDSSFQGTLMSYQQTGVDWLAFLHRWGFGGLLADEMGLGKTVQILAFFSSLRTNLPVLIVCPTSLLYNWAAEFRRFLPSSKVTLHAGVEREQSFIGAQSWLQNSDAQQNRPFEASYIPPSSPAHEGLGSSEGTGQPKLPLQEASESSIFLGIKVLQPAPQFVLTSYAILRQDSELFSRVSFEVVVLDESNAIKNITTQTAQAALKLKAKARFCLSGTPIENRASELTAQFALLMPKLLATNDAPELMQQKIRPFLLRRRKSDVELQLPEKVLSISWVEMNEAQQALYNEFWQSSLKRLKPLIAQDGVSAHRMEILEAILRLRQICADPRLVGGEGMGAKLEEFCKDWEELKANGRKVLVFSQFTSMLDLIEQAVHEKPLRIDGGTSAKERAEQVRRFQEEGGSQLFLLSLKAGGVGLNLTAADDVVLFDPWWNEAVENQAIDRAHRIGRSRTVFVRRYLTPGSIEEKMLNLKASKQDTADRILDSQEPRSIDDLLELEGLIF